MSRCFLLPIAVLAFASLALPAVADPAAPLPRPSNLRSDILYTHRGEFVQVKPMRALTLNAHVTQFTYDPLGLEIAIAGSETSGDQTTYFVKTLDARTGHEISRYAVTAPSDAQSTWLGLLGFSTSGKFLLLQRFTPMPNDPSTAQTEFLRWDLSANPPTTRVIDPQSALSPDEQSVVLAGSADCRPSPNKRWLLFTQNVPLTPQGNRNALVLYDPERDTSRLLTLPPHTSSYFWHDNTHLQFQQDSKEGQKDEQIDVVTGAVSPFTAPLEDSAPAAPVFSKQYPDLSLEIDHHDLEDSKKSGGRMGINIVWVRRTPFGKMPLGVAAAGLLSSGDQVFSAPAQVEWSPTGKQIACVSSDELCVSDLTAATGLLPHEKMAVGLKLSCAEEQTLAMTNLKQIGLGIMQYSQDMDEKFPPADGWMKSVYPYIKSADVFGVDGHAVVYEQPPGLTLASVDSPAETEMAYMDLPCARVTLFCDGHVKVFPK